MTDVVDAVQAGGAVRVFCPSCGQKLRLPTIDLTLDVVCPRCKEHHALSEIVDPSVTINAIPSFSSDESDSAETLIDLERAIQADEATTPQPEMIPLDPSSDTTPTNPESPMADFQPSSGSGIGKTVVSISAQISRWFGKAWFARSYAGTLFGFAVLTTFRIGGQAMKYGFLLLLVLRLLGFFGDFFDEDLKLRLRDAVGLWWSRLQSQWNLLVSSHGNQQKGLIARFVCVTCFMVLAISGVFPTLGEVLGNVGSSLAILAAVSSGGIWAGFSISARKSNKIVGLIVDTTEASALKAAASRMPDVLDLRDTTASNTGHELIDGLLSTLEQWRPRKSNYEKHYQHSLVRSLSKHLPGSEPQEERNIEGGRADIIIGDSVLIEMKCGLTNSSTDRAIGQLSKYARGWDHRGPVILLVCNTLSNSPKIRLKREMQALAAQGYVVRTVIFS